MFVIRERLYAHPVLCGCRYMYVRLNLIKYESGLLIISFWYILLQLTNEGYSPNVKKDRKKFGLRKKKSSKGSSVDLTGSSPCKATESESASPLSVSFPGTEVFRWHDYFVCCLWWLSFPLQTNTSLLFLY